MSMSRGGKGFANLGTVFWSVRSERTPGESLGIPSRFEPVSSPSSLQVRSTLLIYRNYSSDAAQGDTQRAVQVALVGAPNAGKSTLLNALVGKKISAVSQKTNTTHRNKVGYFEDGLTQAVIFDTPGVVEKRQYMDQTHGERVESAWNSAGSSDLVLLTVDAFRQLSKPDPRVIRLIQTFRDDIHAHGGKILPRTALVLTKVDKCSYEHSNLAEMSEYLLNISETERVFLVSGLRGIGLKELRSFITSCSKQSPWIDTEGFNSDKMPAIAREIIKEKIFRAYYKEIPYATQISITNLHHNEESVWIRAKLSVPSNSAKTIVIGKKGSAIGSVERAVQRELSNMYKKDAHVSIRVECD